MTVKLRVAVAALASLALSRGTPAAAHPEFSALGTNRYVTAAVFENRVDVTDALLEGTLASGEERKRLDGDGDGRISDAELRAAEARLGAEAATLIVEVDGRALSAPFAVGIDIGDDRAATTSPVVIERRASFSGAWPESARRLRLVVTREPPRVLDTELGVVLGPGLKLASGSELATFRGPRASALEERAATFDIATTMPAKRQRRAWPAAAAGLGVLLVAAVGLGRRRAKT
jgi:hypothetical protein